MSIDIQNPQVQQVEGFNYFATSVYKVPMPQHLAAVHTVGMENLARAKADRPTNELYPVDQTGDFQGDERIAEFSQQVVQLAWDMLHSQGYAMEHWSTVYESMWMQEHHKFSGMEQHTHGGGVQIVGFYFLDTPDDSSRLIIHDPRPAKLQIDLPEANMTDITFATRMINFIPQPGELYLTNAWLPHSFTRNGSDDPVRFVHINITVRPVQSQCCPPAATVI